MTLGESWQVETREPGGARAATARLVDDALLLEHALGVSVVELGALDGVVLEGQLLTLHHHEHGALAVVGTDVASLARAVTNAATVIPELAASLRVLGATRARPGSDHDAWFGPLLAARRAAHAATDAAGRLAAFDAKALLAAAQGCVEALAAARATPNSPEARALAEELRELAEPYALALRHVAAQRALVESSADAARITMWRSWVASLREAFAAADRAWEAMLPALAEPGATAGPFWRRVLRRGAAR